MTFVSACSARPQAIGTVREASRFLCRGAVQPVRLRRRAHARALVVRVMVSAASFPERFDNTTATVDLPKEYDHELVAAYYKANKLQLAGRAAMLSTRAALMAAYFATGRYRALAETVATLGPTFVKFGQALSARPDIVGKQLADELTMLQDNIQPIPHSLALAIVSQEVPCLLETLSPSPVAAASLCSVYKAKVEGKDVAVKVQRPGIRKQVAADSRLLRIGAQQVEKLKGPNGERIVMPEAVAAVDEFSSRLFEEMDFAREARNIQMFAGLYGDGGSVAHTLPAPGARVPEVYAHLCSENVLVMEWLEGTKLVSRSKVDPADLPLVKLGIRCTLSQLVETGVMHADPHGGNLLKVDGQLAYLDFGLVSYVPQKVRDGLVCVVALLIAKRDYYGVARLFNELMLLPAEVVEDPLQLDEFAAALEEAASGVLDFTTKIPEVRFDVLLSSLLAIAPRFQFKLPPYFLNNARALATLEGMAKSADPSFNVIAEVYPFACQRLLQNPDNSPLLKQTLFSLTHDDQGNFSLDAMKQVLDDSSAMTGLPRHTIAMDALRYEGGRTFAWRTLCECFQQILAHFREWFFGLLGKSKISDSDKYAGSQVVKLA